MEKRITIFDTTFTDYEYEDYLEFCNINGIEPAENGSADFLQWCMEETSNATECDWENLGWTKAEKEHYPFFVTGILGLWNGRPHTHSIRMFYGLKEAIESTLDDYIYDYKVYLEDGVVYVEAMHHDGTNCFEIHLVSKKGMPRLQSLIDSGRINSNDLEFKKEWFKKLHKEDVWG